MFAYIEDRVLRENISLFHVAAARKTKGRPVPALRVEGMPTRRGKIRFARIESVVYRNGTLHHFDLTKNDIRFVVEHSNMWWQVNAVSNISRLKDSRSRKIIHEK